MAKLTDEEREIALQYGQVRVRGVPSQHFADAYYGGAVQALAAAAQVVAPLVHAREGISSS